MCEDPFGDFCERIMTMLSSFALMVALSVYYTCIFIKFKLIFAKLAILRVYNEVSFFLLKKWNTIYWKHIYEVLYLFGLRPAITDEDIDRFYARLQAQIENNQYPDDLGVQRATARARALLESRNQKEDAHGEAKPTR